MFLTFLSSFVSASMYTIYYCQSDLPNNIEFVQGSSSSTKGSCTNGNCKAEYDPPSNSGTVYIYLNNVYCSNYVLYSGEPTTQSWDLRNTMPSECKASGSGSSGSGTCDTGSSDSGSGYDTGTGYNTGSSSSSRPTIPANNLGSFETLKRVFESIPSTPIEKTISSKKETLEIDKQYYKVTCHGKVTLTIKATTLAFVDIDADSTIDLKLHGPVVCGINNDVNAIIYMENNVVPLVIVKKSCAFKPEWINKKGNDDFSAVQTQFTSATFQDCDVVDADINRYYDTYSGTPTDPGYIQYIDWDSKVLLVGYVCSLSEARLAILNIIGNEYAISSIYVYDVYNYFQGWKIALIIVAIAIFIAALSVILSCFCCPVCCQSCCTCCWCPFATKKVLAEP